MKSWWLAALATAGLVAGMACQVGAQGLKLAHEPRPVDQPPKYLGSIALPKQGRESLFPQSLVVTGSQLYVGFSGQSLGAIYTFEGQKVGEFVAGAHGSSPAPVGMAFDDWGRRYLVDRNAGMVLVFDAGGGFAYRMPPRPQAGTATPVLVKAPGGVAVKENSVYISDAADGLVKVFNIHSLEPIVSFGGGGREEKRLSLPAGLVVTDDGRVLVADAGRGVVEVFSCDGVYAYRFHEPTSAEKLARPEAITLDTEPTGAFTTGRVHVVDSARSKVFVYDYYGNFLFTYGEAGAGGNGLARPQGIAVAPEERLIFIADTQNQEIDVYGY